MAVNNTLSCSLLTQAQPITLLTVIKVAILQPLQKNVTTKAEAEATGQCISLLLMKRYMYAHTKNISDKLK